MFQGADGKIIPLSAATLQKLLDSGAIKPGTHVRQVLFFICLVIPFSFTFYLLISFLLVSGRNSRFPRI
jgi:hypothetical protein